MKKKFLILILCVIALVCCVCCAGVAFAAATPHADQAPDAIPQFARTYVLGDESVVGKYGAIATDDGGYYTIQQWGDQELYSYSNHASGWKAAMQAATAEYVKVQLASDWVAQPTDRVEDGSAILTQFGEGYGFSFGRISLPQGAQVILDLNGNVIDRALPESLLNFPEYYDGTYGIKYGSAISAGVGATMYLIDSDPTAEHKVDGNPKYVYRDVETTLNTDGTLKENKSKQVEVKGGVITGGKLQGESYSYLGGAGLMFENGTLTMNGGTIIGNYATYFGGVMVNGNFTMNGGAICGNYSSSYAGLGVQNGKLVINDGIICGNNTDKDGTIFVNAGTVTMNEGRICGNMFGDYRGCFVIQSSDFTMNGGKINGNYFFEKYRNTISGGGVYFGGNDVVFTMNNGEIAGNKTRGAGGGVFVEYGKFVMNGGKICGNSVDGTNAYGNQSFGGGVACKFGAEFTMNNGTINGNSIQREQYSTTTNIFNRNGNGGGGVACTGGSVFKMNNGTINNNTVYSVTDAGENLSYYNQSGNNYGGGGGVYVVVGDNYAAGHTIFEMSGGEIRNNVVNLSFKGTTTDSEANNYGGGGGVCVYSQNSSSTGTFHSTFTMKGGTICSNTITVSTSNCVASNNYGGGGGVNVFAYSSASEIDISSSFKMTGGEIFGNTSTVNIANNYGGAGGINLYSILNNYEGRTRDASVEITGGEVHGNTLTINADNNYGGSGGLFYSKSNEEDVFTKVVLSGAPQIYNNERVVGTNSAELDCYLLSGQTVTIGEMEGGAHVGIMCADSTPIATGYAGIHPSTYFFTNSTEQIVTVDDSGNVIITEKPTATLPEYDITYGGQAGTVDNNVITFPYALNSSLTYTSNPATLSTATVKKANGDIIGTDLSAISGVGTYYVEFEPNDAEGLVKVWTVVILPHEIAAGEVTGALEYESVQYDGSAKEPAITALKFADDSYAFAADTDYTVAYTDNLYVGTATVTVTFTGNYKGTYALHFDITTVSGQYVITWQYYENGAWQNTAKDFSFLPEISKRNQSGDVRAKLDLQSDSGVSVTKYAYAAGVTDYRDANVTSTTLALAKVVFTMGGANTALANAGTYSVALDVSEEDDNNISPNVLALTVEKHNVDTDTEDMWDVRIVGEEGLVYDGTPKEPTVVIYLDRLLLTEGTDYEIVYNNSNVEAGTVHYSITFKGNYTGAALERSFEIAQSAANSWVGSLNIVQWNFGEFNGDRNFFVANAAFLAEDKCVHFAIAKISGAATRSASLLADIPVVKINDPIYGECYKVTDETAIAQINALEAGQYRLTASIDATGSYNAPEPMATVFEIRKSYNDWATEPYMRGWTYGSFDAAMNTPLGEALHGEAVLTVTRGEEEFYNSATGVNRLAEMGAGDYTFKVNVAETANYNGLPEYSAPLTVRKAENDWKTNPGIIDWTYAAFNPNVNSPVAEALHGTAVLTVTAKDDPADVYFDSANNVNKLAEMTAGQYTFKAVVAETENYNGLPEYSATLTVNKAENRWTTLPTLPAWAYGSYNAAVNVPAGAGTVGTAVLTVTAKDDPTDVYFDSANGVNRLSEMTAGQYTFIAVVAEQENYRELSHEHTFSVEKATNSWTVTPNVRAWTFGGYNAASNAPAAEAAFGDVTVIIKNAAGAEVYNSSTGVNRLATAPAGAYTVTASVAEDPNGNYGGITNNGDVTFSIAKAANDWKITPNIRGWQFGSYNGTDNAANAESVFGSVVFVVKNGEKEVFNSKTGVNELAALGAGEYAFTAHVDGTNDYAALDYAGTLTVRKADNFWQTAPNITSWVVGEFDSESNMPIGAGVFGGNATIKITDLDGEVVYFDSANGVDRLSEMPAGSFLFTAHIEGTDDFADLYHSGIFEVFEPEGLPWWAILLIVIGALALAALIIFLLWKFEVFTILTRKLTTAIRTRATVEATVAAVRSAQRAEKISASFFVADAATEAAEVEETDDEYDADDDELSDDGAEFSSEHGFDKAFNAVGDEMTYKKTVLSKLISAPDVLKARYSEIKNTLLGFKKARVNMSKARESFYLGKRCFARISVRGKTLCLYMAMAPQRFVGTKYAVQDVSDVKTYADTPSLLRLRSDRSMRYAKDLVEMMMNEMGATPIARKDEDYVALFNAIAMLEKKRLLSYAQKKGKRPPQDK